MKRAIVITTGVSVLLAVGCGGSSSSKKSSSGSTTAGVTSGTTGGTTGGGTTGGGTTGGGTTGGGTTGGGTTPVIGGTGVFTDGSSLLPGSSSDDWAVAAGDVDGDGDDDVVIASYGGPARLLRNTTSGLVLAPGAFPAINMSAADLHLVDLNGDGDLDVVVGSILEPLRVFTNNGTGGFTLQGEYVQNNDAYTYKLAIGDANGDGRDDVYMANAGVNNPNLRGQDQLLLSDGSGGLVNVSASALPGLQDDSLGASFVDVDGDNDLDVVVGNFTTPAALLLNNGAGTFSDASGRLPALTNRGVTSLATGDVDGDGHADVLLGNEGVGSGGNPPPGLANSLWLNGGTGTYSDASAALPLSADATFNVRLVDVDADGDLDALVANLRAVQNIWINNGGVFTDATASNYPAANISTSSFSMATGDFNNDRALDVIYVRRGMKPMLLLNTPR